VGERLILRLRHAPDAEQLEVLNRDFADTLVGGAIEPSEPLPQEEGEFPGYARLVLRFDRREIGRLRAMIDRLNAFVAVSAPPPSDAGPLQVPEASLPPDAESAEQE
jgi:hypothetical protein